MAGEEMRSAGARSWGGVSLSQSSSTLRRVPGDLKAEAWCGRGGLLKGASCCSVENG